MAVHPERCPQDHCPDTYAKVELQGGLGPQPHNERLFTGKTVVVTIPEIVHNQKGVYDESAGKRSKHYFPGDGM